MVFPETTMLPGATARPEARDRLLGVESMTENAGERVTPGITDIVIITRMSGAGRSTAAKSLEALGWFVVDNLPPGLLPTMLDLAARSNGAVSRMAAVVDVRSRAFSTDLKSAISDLGARGATA